MIVNTFDGETYIFDDSMTNKFAYTEHDSNCQSDKIYKIPYNMDNCPLLEEVCQSYEGMFTKPIYPSLLGLWKISFEIPAYLKVQRPFPVGPFYLKARAEICFRGNMNANISYDENAAISTGSCCAYSNMYQDESGTCLPCPSGSSPRLNGYYCESCPPGYQQINPGVEGWGCTACPIDTFKDSDGNAACKPCPSSQDTGKKT